jgi:hypothetical protein
VLEEKKKRDQEMKAQNRKRGLTENETKPSSSAEDTAADVFSDMYREIWITHLPTSVSNAT